MFLRRLSLLAAALPALAGCSTTFNPLTCAADADCGDGLVCGSVSGEPVCMAAADAPLRIGMSAPVSGPSQELGTAMKLGVTLAIDAQNKAGGVRGRPLSLVFRDDAYMPDLAEKNARALLDVQATQAPTKCPTTSMSLSSGQPPVSETALDRGPNGVLAVLGSVGTPTMLRAAPIALETGALFFGAFTGASKVLRDDTAGACKKYVFNVRASYADEARAALEYFFSAKVPDAAHLLSFDQNDTFGQAGYDGLVAAYKALRGDFSPAPADPTTPIHRFRYQRDDASSVPAQVDAAATYLASLLAADSAEHTIGIFMTDTYGPAASFITGIRQWQYANDTQQTMLSKATRLHLHFINVSFVGPNALAERLKSAGTIATPAGDVPYTDGVMLSQVVPNYESDQSDIVRDYQSAIETSGEMPSFTSLEGYIDARVFIAGLQAHEGAFAPEALISTFEKMPDLSLGLGAQAGYSQTDHNYSKSVWGTALDAGGSFQNRYYWAEGTPLQLFE
ncbi:putative leucine/isoleucine/valine-binding protein precursor [Minicystis rosea]|nr:putative leucine/isoleucine/valine-binding protein precursor [Minicystis rosea]